MTGLALTRLHARVLLVDDVDAPLAADDAVVAIALHQVFQRIDDFHGVALYLKRKGPYTAKRSPVKHFTGFRG